MSQTFLALTRNATDMDWLQSALVPVGQVLSAGRGSLDELLSLVDATSASILFIGLDRDNLTTQSSLIEGMVEARPLLAIVALGDGLDNHLVLNAMRAGARDFIAYGARASEVAGLARRLTKRLPSVPPVWQGERMTAIFTRDQGGDSALVATHLAMAMQAAGQRTLLLDLGLPAADSLGLLGLESTFFFGDALRNLRRLDTSLISSAFAKHAQGLSILACAEHGDALESASAAEIYLLLGAFNQSFQQIVVNLAGQPDSEALRILLNRSSHVLWLCDQSVPGARRNLSLLNFWRDAGLKLDHVQLLVDRYLKGVAPDAKALGETFDLAVYGVLPFCPEARLNAKNLGQSLYETAPREKVSQTLRQLGEALIGHEHEAHTGWFRRWSGRP
ncbi:pilus assembly protein [Pseudomonas sp. LRF_L74]|uniref:pilus assembly protein n=1 Tax=Pseudomonas sp. LRF_L74 TaxID=3369422 RepID=UPI003F63F46A